MKTIATIFCFFLLIHCSYAAVRTAISNAGNGWSVASNWSASGIPQDGDIVVIPVGMTMTVK